ACRPTIAFLLQFLFFEVARWEIRRSVGNNIPGATFLFSRDTWEERPFRPLDNEEDNWFLRDHMDMGAATVAVRALELFLAVRRGGNTENRGHTWVKQSTGQIVESYLQSRPIHTKVPEDLLPDWALEFYRGLRADLLGGAQEHSEAIEWKPHPSA